METVEVHEEELNLDSVLSNGQSFRWTKNDAGVATGVAGNRLWQIQRKSDSLISFQVLARAATKENYFLDDDVSFLFDYFHLRTPCVAELNFGWSGKDAHFGSIFQSEENRRKFRGIRILRQDPVECLFAFICSSNNNIQRISQMIARLCETFGEQLLDASGIPVGQFAFPKISSLAQSGVEKTLRDLGFGYRAKYIAKTAQKLETELGGEVWLRGLRERPYEEARASLLTLNGVGPKVADCVCLMALDKHHVVPIDTHVFQITAKHYLPAIRSRKLNPDLYKQIGEAYLEIFGDYAGWAQSVLFSTNLRQFSQDTKEDRNSLKGKRRKRKKIDEN